MYRCLWRCTAAAASSILGVAGGDSAEVAVEVSVAGSQVEIMVLLPVWKVLSGFRKDPNYSLPFCGIDSHHKSPFLLHLLACHTIQVGKRGLGPGRGSSVGGFLG